MGNALFIVWRETIEAMLVIGILHGWLTSRPAARPGLPWLWGGIAAGLAVAGLLAATMMGIQSWVSEPMLDWIQAVLPLLACGLIVQMVWWMRRHGAGLKRELENGLESAVEQTHWLGIAVLAAVAVGREGAETVVFLYGSFGGEGNGETVAGGVIGFLLALVAYGLLSRGGRFLSWQRFFRITEVLLLTLGGALLVDGIEKLVGLEVLPALADPLWDSRALFDDTQRAGGLFAAFTGYRAMPSGLAYLLLATYWSVALAVVLRLKPRRVPANARVCETPNQRRTAYVGLWLRRHRGAIITLQWLVVLFYLALVVLPAFLPLPSDQAHIWNNLTRFAQFAFWGIWWPFVILSVILLGRTWCGLFCPEGALTEWSSRYGLGLAIPRWVRWGGWPFVAFIMTTVFGQMVSVYEYPKPALLILGGSTLAAIGVGLLWGREKRVWCRYLCPVSGVFGLLAKIAPVHYRVDRQAWSEAPRQPAVNCAPLLNIRNMKSASACHMCGRCAGERGAVSLRWRSPEAEILSHTPAQDLSAERWPLRLLIFGILGVALGAFQWSASPWLVAMKQYAAEWLIENDILWAFEEVGHWWLLTHYPERQDVFSWLDGSVLLSYIALEALVVGGWIWLWLQLAARRGRTPFASLALTLIPLAAASLFIGLSQLTTSQLAAEGMQLPWANALRFGLLLVASAWSVSLAWRRLAQQQMVGSALVSLATLLPLASWGAQFYLW